MVMGNCLKCGNKIDDRAAFCDDCLAILEQYPVKPGTVAHIQPRPQYVERKVSEDYREKVDKVQLAQANKTIRLLVVLTLILSALLLTAIGFLLESLTEQPEPPAIGRNYTTTHQTIPQP